MRLGKFFLIRHKSMPGFLLEVENGATDEGTLVTVSESETLGHDLLDHQLWYFDRVSHTVRTKLNDFCLMNGTKYVCYFVILFAGIFVLFYSFSKFRHTFGLSSTENFAVSFNLMNLDLKRLLV